MNHLGLSFLAPLNAKINQATDIEIYHKYIYYIHAINEKINDKTFSKTQTKYNTQECHPDKRPWYHEEV